MINSRIGYCPIHHIDMRPISKFIQQLIDRRFQRPTVQRREIYWQAQLQPPRRIWLGWPRVECWNGRLFNVALSVSGCERAISVFISMTVRIVVKTQYARIVDRAVNQLAGLPMVVITRHCCVNYGLCSSRLCLLSEIKEGKGRECLKRRMVWISAI